MSLRLRFTSGILCLLVILSLFSISIPVRAQETVDSADSRMLSRGEAVSIIVEAFDLKNREQSFLTSCSEHLDECFFVFAAMSNFDGISFDPLLRLYPDLSPYYRYYEAINIASMLGLIHGYLHEDETPFRPEVVMTRIQALKVVLGAGKLMEWKDRFELASADMQKKTPYKDAILLEPEGWWYNRYLNFAYTNGIAPKDDYFNPDDIVTVAQLQEMINNTKAFMEAPSYAQKTVAQGNTETQSFTF